MRWLFLRGQVPQDRSPNEIKFNSIEDCHDMWEELFYAMVRPDEIGKVLYWGGHRKVYYSDNFCVEWVDSLKYYKSNPVDIIVARGGFKEYEHIFKLFPNAYKVYYGANHGLPKKKYDMVLVDSEHKQQKAREKGHNAEVFWKPASHIFKRLPYRKKYDVCYVAIHPMDKRKNIKWVYKTCPEHLRVLQLGNYPQGITVPENFTVKKILHTSMPKAMNKCKVAIVPYTSEDAGPRVISEFVACGLPVVARDSVEYSRQKFGNHVWLPQDFWTVVECASSFVLLPIDISVETAAKHLRGLILDERRKRNETAS